MERQACYVVSDMGRERFIWATSAREAREKAAAARTAEPVRAAYGHTFVLGAAPSRPIERQVRYEAAAAR